MTALARTWPLIGAASFALTACAITKIDVDVYKGPLSNHEEVQMERMAVMAIGAKPLLIRLRDSLEWPDDKMRKNVRLKKCRVDS
jgi:hypothetical protein